MLYRRGDGTPVALEDRCCHRALPLSLGRIEGDDIRCGYHGLLFEPSGRCVEVPGQRTVPPGAEVRAYPVVERDRVVWIWLGDPVNADAALILDLFWHGGPDWATTEAYHRVAADYRLMLDIQLDATHATYVHPATLGSDAIQDTPPHVERDGEAVRISRWMIGVEPPPIWALAGGFKDKVDRWILATYRAPTACLFDIGAAEAGTGAPEGDRGRGITNRTTHLVTPETGRSCHYFWLFARNYRQDDAALSERLHPGVHQTFQEDVDAIEAQQKSLDRGAGAAQIDVNADNPTIQARRILAELIAAE